MRSILSALPPPSDDIDGISFPSTHEEAGPLLKSTSALCSLACANMPKIDILTRPTPLRISGEYRARTDDPLLAGQVL